MQIEAADSVPIGHPARTYHQGNLALEALLDELERNMAEAEDASAICREFPKLMAIHQHYGIKEMLFMTVLYRHGVTGPSQALWKADDEIKKEIRALVRDLLPTTCMERKERMVAVMTRLREMVSKDEKILLPMSLRFFTIEDWYMVYRDSLLMGAGFLPEIPHWEEGDVWCEKRLKEETAKLNDSRVKLPTGELTLGELKCLFSHLPLDITFIDKDDVLRFFVNEGRVFDRPVVALGSEVYHCHPPEVLPMVRQLIADFKSGKRDRLKVWKYIQGKPVGVTYMAVRENGEYIGTVEVVQDFTKALEHFCGSSIRRGCAIMERTEKAVELKHQGYNCCQAVLAAFADVLDLPEEVLKRIGAPFGSGMGGMDGACGALCGAEMVLGLKDYEGKPMHAKAKALHEFFRDKSGATICRKLKGIDTGKVLCTCDDCVRHGVQAVMNSR